jgi:argininosuccinate lyase
MEAACTPELFATHRALAQVKEGVPFRAAYRAAAEEGGAMPAPDEVLTTYVTDGTPGQVRPDVVRRAIESHSAWLEG